MDIPELEKLAEAAIKGSKGDRQLAQSNFARLAVRDPQAVFVMADAESKSHIAKRWFAGYVARQKSPQGEGKTIVISPDRASLGASFPNNSASGAILVASPADHGSRAPDAEPQPSGGASSMKPLVGRASFAPPARPQSVDRIRAAGVVARQIAETVFDSFKVPDGICVF